MLDLSGRQSGGALTGGALSFPSLDFLAAWPPHLNVSTTDVSENWPGLGEPPCLKA
jgi:hypothetical protein